MKRLTLPLIFAAAAVLGAGPAWSSQLYWLDSAFSTPRLTRANLDGSNPVSIDLPAMSLPQSVAMDATTQTLYWTELSMQNANVEHVSADLSGYAPPAPGPTPWSCLRGIAVDAANHKLYVTSTNLQTGPVIERMNPDGSGRESLIQFGSGSPSEPRAIALDAAAGRMYWCDFGARAIRRAAMTPGASWVNVITGLYGPSGIALDLANQRIYWTDANSGSIGRANLDGSGPVTLVSNLATPMGITLDPEGGRIYWCEIGVPRIRSARLDGTDLQTVPAPVSVPTGVWVQGSSPADVPPSLPDLEFALGSPAPNPMTEAASIVFSLPQEGRVRIGVFDVQGREVMRLADGSYAAGSHAVVWDGRSQGARAADGVYFVRCVWDGKSIARRVTLVR